MTVESRNGLRKQAEVLATENRKADPCIERVFWFRHTDEIRLVETTAEVPQSDDSEVHPYYFPPSPEGDLTAPSAVALIRPDEVGHVRLPDGWGGWDDAVEL